VVERLPRKRKALGSVPSSEKKNQKKKEKKRKEKKVLAVKSFMGKLRVNILKIFTDSYMHKIPKIEGLSDIY